MLVIDEQMEANFLWGVVRGALRGLGVPLGEVRVLFLGAGGRVVGERLLGEPGLPVGVLRSWRGEGRCLLLVCWGDGEEMGGLGWEGTETEEATGKHISLHPKTILHQGKTYPAGPPVTTIPQIITSAIEGANLITKTGTNNTLTYHRKTTGHTETFTITNLHKLPTYLLTRQPGDTIITNNQQWETNGGTFAGPEPLVGVNPELEEMLTQEILKETQENKPTTETPTYQEWVKELAPNHTEETQLILYTLNTKTKTINSTAISYAPQGPIVEHPNHIKYTLNHRKDLHLIIQRFDQPPTPENLGELYGYTPEGQPMTPQDCALLLKEANIL